MQREIHNSHRLSPLCQSSSEHSCQSSCFWLSGLLQQARKINFLTASIFSSSQSMPHLFSNLFFSLMNVLRMSSSCTVSSALSRSEVLLISDTYADCLSDMFLCSYLLGVARHASNPFFPCVCCTFLNVSFAVVQCRTWSSDASIVLNSSSEKPTASAQLSNLSVLSTPTSIVSPPSGHACVHKCKSDMKCQNYPCWFGSTKFCNDALMLLNMSILPLTVSSMSVRSCCITSAISCLNGCWNVTISAVVTIVCSQFCCCWSCCCCCRGLSRAFERFHTWCRLTTLRCYVKCKSVLWQP